MNLQYILRWNYLPRTYALLLALPLSLAFFTHFWNLTGFPAIYMDEDIYIRKALHALEGLPLEPDKTNPMYGWLYLTVILKAIGYPNSFHPTADGSIHSVEVLYLIPRIFIGVLAIIDTFLIFKIVEYHYKNKRVALIASILFAVMPMTWLTRYTLLESIQLPFLLSSILTAVYTGVLSSSKNYNKPYRAVLVILFSGIFLGSAIFVKIPAVAMVPLLALIIYRNNKSVRALALWFMPIVLIPLISPAYAYSLGMFNTWSDGIFYQANRGNQPLFDLTGQNPNNAINSLLRIDPILLIMGTISIIYLSVKRDFLVFLWAVPYIILFYFLGYVSFFHFIPLFPVFCIAFAKTIVDISSKIRNKELGQYLPYLTILGLGIFGLTCTSMLITTNLNSTHFETAAIIAHRLPDTNNSSPHEGKITVIMGESRFFWISEDVFKKDHYYRTYWNYWNDKLPINKSGGVVLIIDGTFDYWKRAEENRNHREELLNLYNNSQTVLVLNKNADKYDITKYPFTSMSLPNLGIGRVEIKTNSGAADLFLDPLKNGR